jgi:hypothetical protein
MSIYVYFHFLLQRLAIEISRSNVTASRANGGNVPDSAVNSGTPASAVLSVTGDSVLNIHLLEPSVMSGSLPLRLVYVR